MTTPTKRSHNTIICPVTGPGKLANMLDCGVLLPLPIHELISFWHGRCICVEVNAHGVLPRKNFTYLSGKQQMPKITPIDKFVFFSLENVLNSWTVVRLHQLAYRVKAQRHWGYKHVDDGPIFTDPRCPRAPKKPFAALSVSFIAPRSRNRYWRKAYLSELYVAVMTQEITTILYYHIILIRINEKAF